VIQTKGVGETARYWSPPSGAPNWQSCFWKRRDSGPSGDREDGTSVAMKMNILATAVALADQDLLARIPVLAAHERTATAELVAHLAALRLRPSLYAARRIASTPPGPA